MTIYGYSTIYNINRSLLKDNSNMKENEYDNGHTERQTVGSNPPELPQIRVSVFENYFTQKPLGDVDLIKWFKTAKFKEQVIAFRTTSNEKVRQRIKRNLPCITPSGIFKTRSRDGLVQHTGFICIDIDHKDNGVFGPEWFEKKKLVAKTFDSLLCASMSISGNGLYLISASLTRTCTWHNSTLWFGRSTRKRGSSPTKGVAMSAACGEPVTMPTHTSIRTRSLIGAC